MQSKPVAATTFAGSVRVTSGSTSATSGISRREMMPVFALSAVSVKIEMPVVSEPVPDVVGHAMCGLHRSRDALSGADRRVDVRHELRRVPGVEVGRLARVDHRAAADGHVAVDVRFAREARGRPGTSGRSARSRLRRRRRRRRRPRRATPCTFATCSPAARFRSVKSATRRRPSSARIVAGFGEHARAERERRHAERESAVASFEQCEIGVTAGHGVSSSLSLDYRAPSAGSNARRQRRQRCRCDHRAAFSAIITTGTFVLPDTSVGMTPQSTTRNVRRSRARASAASTTARGSIARPHLASCRSDGRSFRRCSSRIRAGRRRMRHLRPGTVFAGDERSHRARRGEASREPDAGDERGAILGRRQVVGLHRRRARTDRASGCAPCRAMSVAAGTRTS